MSGRDKVSCRFVSECKGKCTPVSNPGPKFTTETEVTETPDPFKKVKELGIKEVDLYFYFFIQRLKS